MVSKINLKKKIKKRKENGVRKKPFSVFRAFDFSQVVLPVAPNQSSCRMEVDRQMSFKEVSSC